MKSVLIVFGGNSFEHEISCKSVNFILKNIDTTKFNYNLVGIDYNNCWYELNNIQEIDYNWKKFAKEKIENIISYCKNFDIVFPMIHGNTGEDGKIQAFFELNNIKYVGCNSYSSIICYDKLLTKLILEKYSIPQIPYLIYKENLNFKNIKYPVIIKPCKCGSSLGINVAYNKNQLKKYIKTAKKYDSKIIIEKFIEKKKELECAVLKTNKKLIISDIGEIINNISWYDFDSKYKNKTNTIISKINNDIKEEIKEYSKNIFNILECRNISRIDFIYDVENDKLFFNEINTMPGFTEISMYPKLINNYGLNNKDLITKLLLS